MSAIWLCPTCTMPVHLRLADECPEQDAVRHVLVHLHTHDDD